MAPHKKGNFKKGYTGLSIIKNSKVKNIHSTEVLGSFASLDGVIIILMY